MKNTIFILLPLIILIFVAVQQSSRFISATDKTHAIGGDFSLVTTEGISVTQDNFKDKYKIVFFGFTHCPDVCPTALLSFSELMQHADFSKTLPANDMAFLFITVDPERDDIAQMKDYVSNFHDDIIGLTGSAENIKQVQDAYKVYAKKIEVEGMDGYMINHSAFVYVMSPEGEYLGHFAHTLSPQEMLEALRSYINNDA